MSIFPDSFANWCWVSIAKPDIPGTPEIAEEAKGLFCPFHRISHYASQHRADRMQPVFKRVRLVARESGDPGRRSVAARGRRQACKGWVKGTLADTRGNDGDASVPAVCVRGQMV